MHIMEYLEFEDYVAAVNVSRAWHDRCRNHKIVMVIIKNHFRTRWEQTDCTNNVAKQELFDWFPEAAEKKWRKLSGECISKSDYPYPTEYYAINHALRLDEAGIAEHQYDSGRIAFRFNERIMIHRLKRGLLALPQIFVNQDRRPIPRGKWLLSNDLLLAQT